MSVSIDISVKEQQLTLHLLSRSVSYPISSALKGVGQQYGSGCTPLGHHIIRARIGAELPLNAVLIGRRYTGEIYTSALAKAQPDRDWILSRILWLSGCEPGFNRLDVVDTMRRFIYIHGTPNTEPMGIPKSHGCIRMRNKDIVELFDLCPYGTSVYINK